MLVEKLINSSDLMEQLGQVLDDIYNQGVVCRVKIDAQDGFILGPEKICGRVLGLYDDEYGWPEAIEFDSIKSLADISPGSKRHPFIIRGNPFGSHVCLAVSIYVEEYERIVNGHAVDRGGGSMTAKLKLDVLKGTKHGEEFFFEQHDTFLFGRSDDCHICLPDDTRVSRHHFILEANPPDARLRDLGSLNGTYVNGQKYGGRQVHETPEQGALRKYPEVDLRDGDEIKVGDTVLRLSVEKLAVPPPEPIRCQNCGRDVSADVGPARQGDYVCEACRIQAQADPAALLAALLAQAPKPAGAVLKIPDYQIEKKLGEGGMGAVYLARHKQKGNRVALKVMLSNIAVDENSRKQFIREVEVTRTLRHEHIVEFLDFGSAGSVFYFLLEYCQGGSVANLLQRRGTRIKLAEAGPIILEALEGLAYAHSKGYVHRDLKPQNILLAGQEKKWIGKVADMGLSKNFAKAGLSGMTATGSFGGSFPFMPREQVTNYKYMKPVSDVWSMGATFYYLLTGHLPRDFPRGQDPIDVILKGILVPVRKRDSTIPSRVAEVIDRSLSNNPNDRYANAGEMRQALEKAL